MSEKIPPEQFTTIRNWIRANNLIEYMNEGDKEVGFYFPESDFIELLAKFKSEVCKRQRVECKKCARDKCYEAFGVKKLTYGQIFDFIENAPEPEDER